MIEFSASASTNSASSRPASPGSRGSAFAGGGLRGRLFGLYALLVAANVAVWLWALAEFHDAPVLLGMALLAYGLGLRHAVDPDHIAAIDNVTRKLMQDGRQPLTVGLFFALGHSTIVIVACVVIAFISSALSSRMGVLQGYGAIIGTSISVLFLLTIALMNIVILRGVFRTFRRVRAGGRYDEEDLDLLLARGGIMARLFRPLFAMIRTPWLMYPLGLLFGLGFDTATEVALLGMSAESVSQGLPFASVLIFPLLFTAGMTLIDTSDGVLMLGAYGWAFLKPLRKVYYNLTITSASVLVALLVGGIEALGLLRQQFGLTGGVWNFSAVLDGVFDNLGYLIIGIFTVCWLISIAVYRLKNADEVEIKAAAE